MNEKLLISKEVSKLLEDDVAGLWPTDRAKVKAEIRGWLDDSPEEQQHAPSEKDPFVREVSGSSTFEIVGSMLVLLSIGAAIYILTYILSLGLKSGRGGEESVFENEELWFLLHEEWQYTRLTPQIVTVREAEFKNLCKKCAKKQPSRKALKHDW